MRPIRSPGKTTVPSRRAAVSGSYLQWLSSLAALLYILGSCLSSHADDSPYFETDVRPIFKAMCFQCHGEDEELAGGLDLRLV